MIYLWWWRISLYTPDSQWLEQSALKISDFPPSVVESMEDGLLKFTGYETSKEGNANAEVDLSLPN